jgi:hypothetical protein
MIETQDGDSPEEDQAALTAAVTASAGNRRVETRHQLLRAFIEALKGSEFLRAIILLILTAGITGLLVPVIAAKLSEGNYKRQKIFEAELARQSDILKAQSELLRDLSATIWKLQLMNINVSFTKMNTDEATYKKAVEQYHLEATELLGQIRAQLSTARRLISKPMQDEMHDLYFDTLLSVDASLEGLIRKGSKATYQEWSEQHSKSFDLAQARIESVLSDLARELQLFAPLAGESHSE